MLGTENAENAENALWFSLSGAKQGGQAYLHLRASLLKGKELSQMQLQPSSLMVCKSVCSLITKLLCFPKDPITSSSLWLPRCGWKVQMAGSGGCYL